MSQLRPLTLETLEPRRLLAVDVLANVDVDGDARFIPRDLVEFHGEVVMRMSDGKTGPEAWITNGDPDSTRLLKDIRVGPLGSGARDFFQFNGRLYFSANNGFSGLELWVTDGTKATTQQVIDIWPGSENGAPTEMTRFDGLMYFFANDGENGRELYRSNGTAAGTDLIADSVEGIRGSAGDHLMVIGERMFFRSSSADENASGIWVSDGTAAGTRRLAIPGVNPLQIDHMTAFGDQLVFASAGQLWLTDGTEAGSRPIQPTGDDLGIQFDSMTALGDKLYVVDELGLHEISNSLTNATTVSPIADNVMVSSGRVYFWNSNGLFVLEADATSSRLVAFNSQFGTEMGSTDSVPGGMLFNLRRALDRFEIWVTDGTPAGTELLEKYTDSSAEMFSHFEQIKDRVFFTATNGNFHQSVWTIPAPTIEITDPNIPGDVNDDKVVNALDIDAVFAAITVGSTEDKFDLDGDQTVTQSDVDHLLTNILQTRRGDLDLNGKVEFADFLALSASFGKTNATWSDGDSNGDGNVSFADFLALSASFGFE